jgi:hypothetical protein
VVKTLNEKQEFKLVLLKRALAGIGKKPIFAAAMTQEQLKDMRDRVVVLRRFL